MLGRFIGNWGVLVIGICAVVAFVGVAAYLAPATPPAAISTSNAQSSPAAQPRTAAQTAPPAAAVKPAQPSASIAPVSQPAVNSASSQQPAAAQHAMPMPGTAQQTSGQAGGQAALPVAAATSGAGDAAAGRQVFRKCQACHSLEQGKSLVGPSLAGVIGRKAGALPNYNFSPAMKQANITWDAKTLDAYLADPQKLVPGNRMPFPGLKTHHDRTDVIAYLSAPAAAVAQSTTAPAPAAPAANAPQGAPAPGYVADARYTLRSGIAEGRMVYLGVGGAIDGKVNPVLTAAV